MAPNNEYLFLLDHPAISIPITDTDETAVTKSIPIFITGQGLFQRRDSDRRRRLCRIRGGPRSARSLRAGRRAGD